MPRTGKCPNYAGCLLASRHEAILIEDGAPFVCPECHKYLIDDPGGPRPMAIQRIILGGILFLVLMGAGAVYIQVRHYKQTNATGQIGSSFEQAELAAEHGELMPSRHMPADIPGGSGVRAETSEFDLSYDQNQGVKADVLKRLAAMPGDNAKTSLALTNTRQIGRIITIPFPPGHVAPSPADIDQLRAVLATDQLQPFLRNPACVLLILGFADPVADSLRISNTRAQEVLDVLREPCGVTNVIYAVGMGSSTLFGTQKDAERNRMAEIWALLP